MLENSIVLPAHVGTYGLEPGALLLDLRRELSAVVAVLVRAHPCVLSFGRRHAMRVSTPL